MVLSAGEDKINSVLQVYILCTAALSLEWQVAGPACMCLDVEGSIDGDKRRLGYLIASGNAIMCL